MNYNRHISRDNLLGSYLGNYRLIRFLGYGRFASVYLGEHQYLRRMAAIKILNVLITQEEETRFLAEAQFLANLVHPHIVRVLDFAFAPRRTFIQNSVVTENVPFLVMEYSFEH